MFLTKYETVVLVSPESGLWWEAEALQPETELVRRQLVVVHQLHEGRRKSVHRSGGIDLLA